MKCWEARRGGITASGRLEDNLREWMVSKYTTGNSKEQQSVGLLALLG